MKNRLFRRTVALILLSMTILSLSAQERTIKRIVAIGRFSNETQYGKGLFYDRDNDPMRKQAMDILSAKLAASGKFILLEKDDLDVLLSEGSDSLNTIKADYVILGSLTQFGRKTEGQQKVFSSTKSQTVEAGVSLRLVEVATRLTIYADEAMQVYGQALARIYTDQGGRQLHYLRWRIAGHPYGGRLSCLYQRQKGQESAIGYDGGTAGQEDWRDDRSDVGW